MHTVAHRSAGAKCWSKMIRADLGTCDKELFHETWPWRLTMNFSCWQDKGQLCDINPCQLSTYSQLPAYFPVKLFFVKKWLVRPKNLDIFLLFFRINLCLIQKFPFSMFVEFGMFKILPCEKGREIHSTSNSIKQNCGFKIMFIKWFLKT